MEPSKPPALFDETPAFDQIDAAHDLKLTSPAFGDGDSIPELYSAYGENRSPELQWTGVPIGTRRILLMLEDPDAHKVKPFVHWLILMPGDRTSLPAGVDRAPTPETVPGAVQGKSSADTIGYMGPKPPSGDPPHRYHFEIFALGHVPDLSVCFDRAQAMAGMRGLVLSKGRLTGVYVAK